MTPLEPEREVEPGRVVRAGDLVGIVGLPRACVRVEGQFRRGFRVLGFRGDEVHVVGARTANRVEMLRAFPLDRLIVARQRRRRAG